MCKHIAVEMKIGHFRISGKHSGWTGLMREAEGGEVGKPGWVRLGLGSSMVSPCTCALPDQGAQSRAGPLGGRDGSATQAGGEPGSGSRAGGAMSRHIVGEGPAAIT